MKSNKTTHVVVVVVVVRHTWDVCRPIAARPGPFAFGFRTVLETRRHGVLVGRKTVGDERVGGGRFIIIQAGILPKTRDR